MHEKEARAVRCCVQLRPSGWRNLSVSLPLRVVCGQAVAAGLAASVGCMWTGAAAVGLSVVAGAASCMLPGALFAQWVWRRGVTSVFALMVQPFIRLALSALLLGAVLGGVAGVQPLAVLAGFVIAALVQPAVLIWASQRREA